MTEHKTTGHTGKNPIFITGCPRTGTSMLTRILVFHGAWVGKTIGPSVDNPLGYYENRKFSDIMKAQLKQNNHRAMSTPPIPERLEFDNDWIDQVKHTVRANGNKPWVIKDSKLLLVYPLWASAFRGARWVLTRRPVNDVIESMRRSPVLSRRANKSGDPEEYYKDVITALAIRGSEIASNEKSIIVDTDLVAKNDVIEVRRFVEFCGLYFNEDAYEKAVDRNLWHG